MTDASVNDRYRNEYSREFVKRWDDLIGWDGRAAGEADFFPRLLAAHGARQVVDIAAGTGFHSVMLANAGFEVTASDGSQNMIEQTKENAKRHGVKLADTRSCDWRNLHEAFGEDKFDALVCLGNSFTHLQDHEARRDALESMFRVLKPGGMLVIDHRNYDRMLDQGFSSKHSFYYTGAGVDARPVELTRTRAKFQYSFADGQNYHLTMYPLKEGYIAHLLEDCGFVGNMRYGDFERPFDQGDVDFIQQIAFKPRKATNGGGGGKPTSRSDIVRDTQAYYDGAADEIYREIWGENIHLGVFDRADEGLPEAMVRSNEKLSAELGLKKSDYVLDVGCGYGAAARFLAERFGCRVLATNISDRELAHARDLTKARGLDDRVDYQWADFHDLPFLADSFDCYLSQEAFLHAVDKDAVLREAQRVLKPGGRLVFTDILVRRGTSDEDRAKISERVGSPVMWDAPDYAEALQKLGLTIERQEDMSQHVAPTYGWVRRELERRRPEFEKRIGKELVDKTSAALQFWVDSAEAGRIGWGWFVARK